MILLLPVLILFLVAYVAEVRTAIGFARDRGGFLRTPILRATIVFLLLVAVPWLVITRSEGPAAFIGDARFLLAASLLVSALISYTWYRYLTWLDPFEREPFRWELTVFLLSCSIALAVPRAYGWFEERTGFTLTGDHWNDWWYCVGVIGGIEELAKLLPLLFVWRLTRQVNEPFDFILYASVSALGFAFVENTGYLRATNLEAVMGRALMASVAHMFFSSIPAYALAMHAHRRERSGASGMPVIVVLLLAFVLAATCHGFYDFWLLDRSRPGAVTVVFFIVSLQVWSIMKNNLLNISPHYTHRARPASRMFRYRLINGMLFILGVALVAAFVHGGKGAATHLLTINSNSMALMLVLTAMHFSAYAPIPGYLAPLRPPGHVLRWFLPRIEWERDLSGARLELRPHSRLAFVKRWTGLMAELPLAATVHRRVVVGDETDWYLLDPEHTITVRDIRYPHLIMNVHADYDTLADDRLVMVHLAGLTVLEPGRSHWEKEELTLLGSPLALLTALPEGEMPAA